jgi:gamma-glutamyltranspeptidase/glutathione hydrolase
MLNPFSSAIRPALGGRLGAVSAAHPLAVAAGQRLLAQGGTAVDTLVAAQAALAVVSPDACGLGGDGFALVHAPGAAPVAVNGAGPSTAAAVAGATTGGASVAIPGLVDAWVELHGRWGRRPLLDVLQPAIEMAEAGVRVDPVLASARRTQGSRLEAGGAGAWALMGLEAGEAFVQPALARTLRAIAAEGRAGLYDGEVGRGIARAVQATGGAMTADDLAAPAALVTQPLTVRLGEATVHVQPPASQGVLLALRPSRLGARRLRAGRPARAPRRGADGRGLRPARRRGPRPRAPARPAPHRPRAGRAARGARGPISTRPAWPRLTPRASWPSSLVSVFDDFGSCVFVPEGGFTLNNRVGGFTSEANAFRAGARPVHTLAPTLVEMGGHVVALSTPGADGQVQVLLQVLLDWLVAGRSLPEAVAAPRWRSEGTRLLVEEGHPARADLLARGHDVVDVPSGDVRFGAVTAAGHLGRCALALADWRRRPGRGCGWTVYRRGATGIGRAAMAAFRAQGTTFSCRHRRRRGARAARPAAPFTTPTSLAGAARAPWRLRGRFGGLDTLPRQRRVLHPRPGRWTESTGPLARRQLVGAFFCQAARRALATVRQRSSS